MRRFVIAITGASGVIHGVRLLQVLREMPDVQTHLVLSRAARQTLVLETEWAPEEVEALADRAYDPDDLAAPIASGSSPVEGMAVVPCSMKTLSAVAHSFGHNLIVRAADVTLKENRRLVLVPRESPLHKGHLELLVKAADLGATIVPPLVAFYHRPTTIEQIVDHTVGKVLEHLGLEHRLYRRWGET